MRAWFRRQNFLGNEWSRRLDTFMTYLMIVWALGTVGFCLWLVEKVP